MDDAMWASRARALVRRFAEWLGEDGHTRARLAIATAARTAFCSGVTRARLAISSKGLG